MQVMTWSGPETRHVSAAAVLVKPDITDFAPFPTIFQVMTWSGPETRHVASAAARWVPSAFILLKEYCRTGDSEASLEAVKVDEGGDGEGGGRQEGTLGGSCPPPSCCSRIPRAQGAAKQVGRRAVRRRKGTDGWVSVFQRGRRLGGREGQEEKKRASGQAERWAGCWILPPLVSLHPPPSPCINLAGPVAPGRGQVPADAHKQAPGRCTRPVPARGGA